MDAHGTRPVLWTPKPDQIAATTLARFTAWVEAERGITTHGNYERLWDWSVSDLEEFWTCVWDFFGVMADGTPVPALSSRRMPGAKWFPEARVNYAEHILRGRDPEALLIQHETETTRLGRWTYRELRSETARIAAGLRRLGVRQGDRVAAYLPNVPETVAAFLAVASIGAIWSSAAPEFGLGAVTDRFAQIEPKVLLAVDGYHYGGRAFDRREVVVALRQKLPCVDHVVLLEQGFGPIAGTIAWEDLRAHEEPLSFTRVPFDHPLWVLYSSGTTGLPKAIVHGHGGILLEQLKVAHLHLDAQAGDRVFWFTTTGWMMWNFLVGALLTPASIILYDGNPATPSADRLWEHAAEAKATIFGVGASYIAACMRDDVDPHSGERDLSALRAVGSTGSPLSPEAFEWVYDRVGSDTWLFSTSGGTDMCTAFVGGVPTLPVRAGELQARALGAKVEAWTPDGQSLTGEVGELVITQPMPSMPLSFWGDTDGARLRETYLATYPGVWRHGDWIEITAHGSAVIYGRSDSTINRGGIRMGTSEIYRAVLGDPDVSDAVVVDVPREGTEGWMALFVVLREGVRLQDELVRRIRRRIGEYCSPRHVPNEVLAIPEVPRTLSGKVLEVPVKRILMGEAPERAASRDSLANPGSLATFVAIARRAEGIDRIV